MTYAEETTLREAILEVIDDGDLNYSVIARRPWGIDHPRLEVANNARLRFADRVLERFKEMTK